MAEDRAEAVAEQLGQIKCLEPKLQAEIERLRHKDFVELKQVIKLHDWLEGKRRSRQSCRVVGESRVGKTVACNAYRLRLNHFKNQENRQLSLWCIFSLHKIAQHESYLGQLLSISNTRW